MFVYPEYITIEISKGETFVYYVNDLEYVEFISIMGPLKEEFIDLLVCLGTENDQPN